MATRNSSPIADGATDSASKISALLACAVAVLLQSAITGACQIHEPDADLVLSVSLNRLTEDSSLRVTFVSKLTTAQTSGSGSGHGDPWEPDTMRWTASYTTRERGGERAGRRTSVSGGGEFSASVRSEFLALTEPRLVDVYQFDDACTVPNPVDMSVHPLYSIFMVREKFAEVCVSAAVSRTPESIRLLRFLDEFTDSIVEEILSQQEAERSE